MLISLICFERNFFSFFSDIEDDVILRTLLGKQITHLHIDIRTTREDNSKTVSNTFALILSLCERLIDLEFSDVFSSLMRLTPTVCLFSKNFVSSTLTKLKVNVDFFYDCLVLLDGRLHSLSTLIINVAQIIHLAVDTGPKVRSISQSSQQ